MEPPDYGRIDPERWRRVQSVFHDVAALPKGERDVALQRLTPGDTDLERLVRRLLEADAHDSSLLDVDVTEMAEQVFTPDDSQTLTGETFGPYRIIKPLDDEGGMGLVFLARREDVGQLAAIKILRDAWVSADRRERFIAEQRTLAQLNHPLIPKLYDADTLADGTPWFAMEYVQGRWLTRHCESRAAGLDERLRLFGAVCEAVQHAHQHLIVHRDLKPANILVTTDGSVKLLDFGIARRLAPGDAGHTKTVVRLMTATHAAPEQIAGGPSTLQADVYSLGVVLYELLTGKPPFDLEGLTPRTAEDVVLERDPVRPSAAARSSASAPTARPSVWADLDVICLTALHKDLGRRYQTVDALMADIDHLVRHEPIRARADSIRYRAGKFMRRHAPALAAAAVVVFALVGIVAVYTVELTAARNIAVMEAAQSGRIQQFMVNLFDAGEIDVAPASDLRVLTLLERGVREAQALDREPAVQAELYQTLASLFLKLGSYERADSLFRRALAQRSSVLGPEHPDVVDTMIAIGLLKEEQNALDEAERMLRTALALAHRVLPRTDPLIAKATAGLGKVLDERGLYHQAIPLFEESVRRYEAAGNHTEERAAAITGLANAHYYLGHLDISETLNREMLELDRQLHGDRHPNVADDLINLGSIHSTRGNHAEAVRHFREALAIEQAWYSSDHPETASAQTILAQALIALGQPGEAEPLLRSALATQRRVYPASHPRIALVLSTLGSAALERNATDEAAAAFTEALAVYRAAYPNGHARVAIVLSNLGHVAILRGEYARADQELRAAVGMLAEFLGVDHQTTATARLRLGRALAQQQRFVDAERELVHGYRVLSARTGSSVKSLRQAREDLVTVYDALNRPDEARRYRDEIRRLEERDAASRASAENRSPTGSVVD